MKKILFIFALITLSVLSQSFASGFEMPSFLPDYYAPAFEIQGQKFALVNHSMKEGVEQYLYSLKDESLALSIENIKCDRPRGKAIFDNILGYLNNEIKVKGGEFIRITQREVHAKIYEKGTEKTIFAYILPAAVQIWSYAKKPNGNYQVETQFQVVKDLVDRQRYIDALSEGNVSMGFWGSEIYDYAGKLIRDGQKKEGLSVLRNLLATSPYNFSAHMDFVRNTDDSRAAVNSARVVIRNTEDRNLAVEAANYLRTELMTFSSVPLLEKSETGLQLIVIPLEPCDVSLLAEVSETYKKITDISVKIRRLKEVWSLTTPDRIPYQRAIQEMLVRMKGENIDFTGWKKDRYVEELKKTTESKDALTKYYVKALVHKVEKETGQYFVDPYLDWFSRILEKYRSNDDRTMYVGITGINIYSGDNNFIFSLHTTGRESQASVLSYYMMLARNLSEEYESRNRLTERIAKELVPASLKSLKIPRSTDPTCPYSYSSGVSRLDQKTLRLSEPVKDSIERIRLQQSNPRDAAQPHP